MLAFVLDDYVDCHRYGGALGAAIDRLDSEGMIDVVSRYSDDGGQLANGICLTERGEWYLEGVRTGMLVQEMLEDEVADR